MVGSEEHARPVILTATDISGLDAPSMALLGLDVPFHQAFACDIWSVSRRFLQENYTGPQGHLKRIHRNVHYRRYEGTRLDLYIAGPPCQAFSPAGHRKGVLDPLGRGMMFGRSVQFIIEHLPRVFMLENSHLILSYPRGTGQFIAQFKELLEAQGYQIHVLKMNTHRHGLPQYRERAYVIGIHRTVLMDAPAFQDPQPRAPCPADMLLNPACGTDDTTNVPTRPGALHALRTALQRLHPDVAQDVRFVDTALSKKRVDRVGAPRALLPALLHPRTEGVWIGSRGRPITFEEAARFQGILAHKWQWIGPAQGFQLIGNTMSLNILQRLLVRLIPFIGFQPAHDPWEGQHPPAFQHTPRVTYTQPLNPAPPRRPVRPPSGVLPIPPASPRPLRPPPPMGWHPAGAATRC